jgi:hypothetical protein
MTEKEQEANDMLQEIASDIKAKLPEGMGFALLAYEFGEGEDRKMLYISDSQRSDVMNAMVEFLQKNVEDPEMFGKDV